MILIIKILFFKGVIEDIFTNWTCTAEKKCNFGITATRIFIYVKIEAIYSISSSKIWVMGKKLMESYCNIQTKSYLNGLFQNSSVITIIFKLGY